MIPFFDANLVIPPHLGNPTDPSQLSPYPCTTTELCQRFATTPERRLILQGLLDFREILRDAGLTDGFQWLGGSFLEDKEKRENQPPNDIDIATLFCASNETQLAAVEKYPILINPAATKNQFHLDHYLVDIAYNPLATVESTRYWIGLFSHNRDRIWKGMLRIELNTLADDQEARKLLIPNP